MLKAGKKAPEFTLPDENEDSVSLSTLLEDGPLILYFYPADFTPGCTREACSFRDMHDDIVGVGLKVVGVSPQDGESHRKFREKHDLPFTLLSDVDKDVINQFDVDGPFGVGVRRATFLIDQDRTILDAVQADVLVDRHSNFIKKAVSVRQDAEA